MRSITNKRICESCGTTDGGGSDKKLLECAGCLSSYFCNTQCQQQSWPLHKKVCRQKKKSVVKIQSTWRGWYTRRQLELNDGQDKCEVCGALDSKDKQLNICNGCKLSLFCSVRCQEYAWKKKNHKIICQQRQMNIQVNYAVTIQSSWRGYMCRLAITKNKESSVLKIQIAWRTYMKRKRKKINLERKNKRIFHKKSRQKAALKIQSAWRATYPTALPKEEALQIIFSPDGYYKSLCISRTTPDDTIIDRISRNYRILSKQYTKLADYKIIGALSRAMNVLKNPRLREEYDLVGLDLENFSQYYDEELDKPSLLDGRIYMICDVLWEAFKSIAIMLLVIMVSKHMMLIISLLVLFGMAFLKDKKYLIETLTLALGIYCMYSGQQHSLPGASLDGIGLCWTFWFGETIVMWCTNLKHTQRSPHKILSLSTIAPILSGWLQGKLWRYGILVVIGIIIVMLVFFVGLLVDTWTDWIVKKKMARGKVRSYAGYNTQFVEMILDNTPNDVEMLESIIEDKMRTVREKIRMHDEIVLGVKKRY